MDREEGMDVLSRAGWLSGTPVEFRNAILSLCRWESLEPGALIHTASQADGLMSGLARGIMDLRSILGRADTPVMHFARPGFWLGYTRVVSPRRSNRVEATARTTVWLARAAQADVRKLLDERPEWWRYFVEPVIFYGDIALDIAADLSIRDSERRCAAVLLRLSGHSLAAAVSAEPADVSITQDDLAGAACLARSTVRIMLGRLAARGLIKQGYGGVVVRAPAALRAFVDERRSSRRSALGAFNPYGAGTGMFALELDLTRSRRHPRTRASCTLGSCTASSSHGGNPSSGHQRKNAIGFYPRRQMLCVLVAFARCERATRLRLNSKETRVTRTPSNVRSFVPMNF